MYYAHSIMHQAYSLYHHHYGWGVENHGIACSGLPSLTQTHGHMGAPDLVLLDNFPTAELNCFDWQVTFHKRLKKSQLTKYQNRN